MDEGINCFVPAAGLGERMRPITDCLPKTMLPVLGKPVLEHILEKLSGPQAHQIGINLHHKKEAITDWVEKSPYKTRVLFFPEDPVLDTGGALKNAESFLSGTGSFLVHNADIMSDIDLSKLVAHHNTSGNMVTLAVHDCSRFNTVAVDGDGNLRGVAGKGTPFNPGKERLTAYTGIAVYSREFLAFLPEGKSSVVDAWLNAAASGSLIGTLDVTGSYWADIGTPAAYASAVFDALKADGETVYFHPEATGCAGARLNAYTAVERGCSIAEGVSLRNCIVLPGSMPGRGAYENCIIGPDFAFSLGECKTMLPSGRTATLIGVGGSDRKYFRIEKGGTTSVLMQCAEGDADFERHIEYTLFFRRFGLPVPELISAGPERMSAIFEDLGDVSLYSWLKCPRPAGQVERLYRETLDIAVTLHITVTGHAAECPLLANRIFDYNHLRWETSYFIERFVKGVRGIAPDNFQALEDEFNRLALKVGSFPRTIIHRDFQSQNVMIGQPETPRIIDYQGARMAPPAYDAASLLWDPYYRLDDAVRARLLAHYVESMSAAAGKWFEPDQFYESLLPCRLQRHMQALGAYGFLSSMKGKKFFLKHVPEALRMLKEEAAMAKDAYPALYTLVMKL
ncbi:MAG: phosphotransferase [Nitrospirae bacterium]|nr:phosphotransferase [Nitrospirota bacterium]